jgi:hypothetical protein
MSAATCYPGIENPPLVRARGRTSFGVRLTQHQQRSWTLLRRRRCWRKRVRMWPAARRGRNGLVHSGLLCFLACCAMVRVGAEALEGPPRVRPGPAPCDSFAASLATLITRGCNALSPGVRGARIEGLRRDEDRATGRTDGYDRSRARRRDRIGDRTCAVDWRIGHRRSCRGRSHPQVGRSRARGGLDPGEVDTSGR